MLYNSRSVGGVMQRNAKTPTHPVHRQSVVEQIQIKRMGREDEARRILGNEFIRDSFGGGGFAEGLPANVLFDFCVSTLSARSGVVRIRYCFVTSSVALPWPFAPEASHIVDSRCVHHQQSLLLLSLSMFF